MDDAGDLIGGFDRRLARQEEWARLTDGRTTRLEDKMDRLLVEMADFRAEMRSNFVTRSNLDEKLRRNQNVTWAAAGVIVAAMAFIAALFGAFEALSPRTPPLWPAPVVVQLPAPAVPSAR